MRHNVNIEPSWQEKLKGEFDKEYFARLTLFVHEEYSHYRCYPPGNEIFNAFNLCPADKVKVVIIGQDPYHGPGQAEGLCFSVKTGIPLPPSLVNIFKEIKDDIGTVPQIIEDANGRKLYDGSLRRWAEQGVLLLNATLTVREHAAASHQHRGWEEFTDAVIETVSRECNHVVFLLWGGYARTKKRLIDPQKHFILESVHPSPLSANRGGWFGNHHFSRCNEWLKQQGMEPIKW
ncbi:MAG: uracil-DNA glycosylase [Bacteroidales bacterium]|nr:uracil-DNA glycosylase [Bacteroidales bacterium]MCM1146908.1 uracil-DNA glycosylase [Bacteroidales bacterium]MCM1205594.1 uracil-DNA glycosylase [Bacillota bacterium]MCM1510295.1 uracil-DNA glycosylase [Clostridium sp.]